MAITRTQLIERLNHSGLLPAAEVAELQNTPEAAGQDAPTLAAELVSRKKLTPFQADALSAEPPQKLVFGEYVVLEQIGEGGMGVVFRARHRRLGRIVALKVLHPSITKSEDAVRRFRREVEASARLTHPNIVPAHDANEEEGVHYLVMEYVDGIDLFHLVKEQGPLPAQRALDYVLQAARGLEHAHERGVVHRDVKPSNLLLDGEGTVRILDMGLVRFIDPGQSDGDSTGSGHLTQTGEILGSFDYMAPEQAIDTKRVDCRADVYSLGCTLYYLISGRAPYRGETSMQKLLAHRENAIPSLRSIQPDLPLALDAVFHRMMAKKAEDRYPSMLELIRDLEACRQASTAKATEDEAADALVEKSYRLVPSHLIVCGTLCMLAVVGGNVFLAYESAANHWPLSEEVLFVKWYALFAGISLFAGIGMVSIGVLMSVIGAIGERWASSSERRARVRPGRMARAAARWLLAVLAGALVGVVVGAGLGVGLATHTREMVRIVGGILVGAFVGAALGGWRAWILILGCAVAGFFVGTIMTGEHGISLQRYGVDFQIQSNDLAMIGFGVVGMVVGAVIGSRMGGGTATKRVNPRTDRAPALTPSKDSEDDPSLAASETVRRGPKRG